MIFYRLEHFTKESVLVSHFADMNHSKGREKNLSFPGKLNASGTFQISGNWSILFDIPQCNFVSNRGTLPFPNLTNFVIQPPGFLANGKIV